MVSNFFSLDNDESSDASRPQQNGKDGPGFGAECGNHKAAQNKRRKKDKLPENAVKTCSPNDAKKKKSKSICHEPAISGDIKNFMESLLDDLKVAAESLFARMKDEIYKLEAEDVVAQPERRESDCSGGNAHLQLQNFRENNHVQHQNHIEKNIRKLHCSNNTGSIPVQNLKDLKSGMITQTFNGGLSQRHLRRSKAAQSNHFDQPLENQVNSASAEKDRVALTVKRDVQSTRLDQNETLQHQKSVVLALGAQNCFGGSLLNRKGKKAINPTNHCEVPEDGDCQIVGSKKSTERSIGDELGLFADRKFSSYTSHQVAASSMYLTLPTVLTENLVRNNSLNATSCNNIQAKNYGNETSADAARANPISDSNTQSGYLQAVRPVERIGDLVGSRGSCHTNLNSSSGSGILHYGVNSGLNVPSQLGLESLSLGNNNLLGQRMNGEGAIRNLRGAYDLPGYYTSNILHNYSSYRAEDNRLMAFQSSDHKDGSLLPK